VAAVDTVVVAARGAETLSLTAECRMIRGRRVGRRSRTKIYRSDGYEAWAERLNNPQRIRRKAEVTETSVARGVVCSCEASA
jgi:hypothetical protein